MASRPPRSVRTLSDLHRAVRAVSLHFDTDTVVVVGSQALLVSRPNTPPLLRTSLEIDAYPANAKDWAERNDGIEASEEVFALFGEGSQFHSQHGFYIDGVDETTARLPEGWRDRASETTVDCYGKPVRCIAPEPLDLLASKLCRLDEKDKAFAGEYARAFGIDGKELRSRLDRTDVDPAIRERAKTFVGSLVAHRVAQHRRPGPDPITPGQPLRVQGRSARYDIPGIVERTVAEKAIGRMTANDLQQTWAATKMAAEKEIHSTDPRDVLENGLRSIEEMASARNIPLQPKRPPSSPSRSGTTKEVPRAKRPRRGKGHDNGM